MAVIKNRFIRALLFSIGIFSVVIGVIGIFLPLLPSTPFLLLAAWCFMQSSERAYKWIHDQPVIGQIIKNWEKNRAISRTTKWIASILILTSIVYIGFQVQRVFIRFAIIALLICVSAFIWTRNENIVRD